MKNRVYWTIQIVLAAVVLILATHFVSAKIQVFDGSIIVAPGQHAEKSYPISLDSMTNVKISGSLNVLNGTSKDIEMYILDAYSFINYQNRENYTSIASSGRVTAYKFDLPLQSSDQYYVVLENGYATSEKEVTLSFFIVYSQIFLGVQISIWILVIWILLAAFFTYYQYASEIKKGAQRNRIETNITAISIALISMVGLSFFLSSGTLNMVNTLFTSVNVILIIWNVILTQRNMRIQLLHTDRKTSLQKLYSIIEKSKDHQKLIQNLKPFMETLDFDLLPEQMKREIRGKMLTLEGRELEAPWNPPIEDWEAQAEQFEEEEAEYYQALPEEDKFLMELENLADSTKREIKKMIDDYFKEPIE